MDGLGLGKSTSGIISIDPRVKLFLFVVTCAFVMGCTKTAPCLLLGSFLTLLLILSGRPLSAIKSYAFFMTSLFIFAFLMDRLHGVPGVLILTLAVVIRMLTPIIMAFTLVFQTTTISQFMASFQKMHVPVQVIIPVVVMFRFIPTVQEEWQCIRQAMAFRGISLSVGGLLRHPVLTLEHILIPLLFSAAAIMDELASASLARGLDSTRERTCLVEVKMGALDYGLLLCGVMFLALLFIYNSGGVG
ncbi:energy-coupling factor transporter transmembrane component T [Eubacterium sp. 1001713B170207_170306_E7]|uniref:energy-coupling factor transporter transmembrane component T family protein n=1 Tax=Eubacterium sp. 1001713B170207_170306_E7 TaxID=2787097 RepID=UPI00189A3892|nr:energy-coupling factor transporter transmembrane component T [Eubacterium sp. 1001713B170207_170306_E7]